VLFRDSWRADVNTTRTAFQSQGSVERQFTFRHFAQRASAKGSRLVADGDRNVGTVKATEWAIHNPDWGLLKWFGNKDVRKINTRDYNEYMTQLTKRRPDFSSSTKNTVMAAFRNVPEVLGANNLTAPSVAKFAEQYLGYMKKSAANLIEAAKTLVAAKEELVEKRLKQFCAEVGLKYDGSTYRKMMKIGEEATRFEPVLNCVPNKWTTVYRLARIESTDFDRVGPST
jgi:hypothetical protein